MRTTARSLLVAVLILGVGGLLTLGATAWMSDSGSISWMITAADTEEPTEPQETVWVCKMIGPPGDARLKQGENPIEVGLDSTDAEEAFSDAHPSFVVDPGEDCEKPSDGDEPVESDPPTSGDEEPEAPSEDEQPPGTISESDANEPREPDVPESEDPSGEDPNRNGVDPPEEQQPPAGSGDEGPPVDEAPPEHDDSDGSQESSDGGAGDSEDGSESVDP